MSDQLTVREDSDTQYFIKVEDHDRDLSNTTVRILAFPDYLSGPSTEIGSGTGAPKDESFVISVDVSGLEPGDYDVEVVADSKVVHPDGSQASLSLSILDSKFDG